jgi:hypothetical protein
MDGGIDEAREEDEGHDEDEESQELLLQNNKNSTMFCWN